MYIVIAGGGLLGLSLVEQLVGRGHDVMVIDPDPAVCAYAETEIGAMVHCGSATSTKSLDAVGLKRAAIAIGMMRVDADNLAFILLAKSMGVPRRLVRMREKDFEEPYRLAGATGIASSVTPLIDQMLVHVEYPEIKGMMRLGKGAIDVFEVTVPEGAALAGLTVEAIAQTPEFPQTCNFVAVENPGMSPEVARGTTVVQAGANVIVLAKEADLQLVIRLLTSCAVAVASA